MNSTNRNRVLLVSGVVILICMSIILGMTWGLFSDMKNVTNHLKAGDLSITLTRTELTKTTINESGYLATLEPNTKPVDFSKPTKENVFDIITDADGNITEKIVPGSKFIAKMKIENNSDVAFGYWIEIVCTDKTSGESLAKQLKITVDNKSSYLQDGLTVGNKDAYIDVLEKGESGEFTVTVEFEDKGFSLENGMIFSDNDGAQSGELSFDLVVYAVQAVDESIKN